MTEVLLFHHALGLTEGVQAFAEDLRAPGHIVHTPDLFEGKTFDAVPDGVANARQVGFGTIIDRGVAAAEGLPNDLVYAGFSLGVMPAQALTLIRPGARGGLFCYACLDPSEFDGPSFRLNVTSCAPSVLKVCVESSTNPAPAPYFHSTLAGSAPEGVNVTSSHAIGDAGSQVKSSVVACPSADGAHRHPSTMATSAARSVRVAHKREGAD